MKRTIVIAIIMLCFLLIAGCSKDKEKRGMLVDLGFIPADVTVHTGFQPMAYYNGGIFVATSDGVWRCNVDNGEWSRSGLDGMNITAVYCHQDIPGRLFAGVATDLVSTTKTLYLSDDGGSSWHAADKPVFSQFENSYENYYCFAVRPGHPQEIYSNLQGGTVIAVSTDGGETWQRMNYMEESYVSDPCNIVFLPDKADMIFQGAESPLDYAWLGRYEIGDGDPVMLGNFTQLVDLSTWGNRRPNELQTCEYTGDNIYVGQEGALSKVNGQSVKFIFNHSGGGKETDADDDLYYTYVKGIWVDPHDTDHIIFGGMLNNNIQPMQLYETFDEGKTIYRYTDKCGMENPCLLKIVSTPSAPALLFEDQNAGKVKVMLYTEG